jgi:pimeloyl-ACP methyl ester carboxylesterase
MAATRVAEAYVDAVRECFRAGPRDGRLDTSLVASAWDLDLGAIEIPVSVWHGNLDVDAPPAMGRWLAEAVPACRARFFAGEGHISLIVKHAESILRALVA